MTTPISNRSQIPPFEAMEAYREAVELAATGRDIVHLSIGQPSSMAPKEVLAEVAQRIASEPLGYTDARGLAPLRERIAQHYAQRYGVEVSPRRIFITAGSSGALLLSLMTAFDAGQRVAIARPCYPAYPNMIQATDLETVYIDTDEEFAFQPRAHHLNALAERPNGLIIASPSNPAGTIIDAAHMKELVEYAEDYRIRLISDEIYHGISYGKDTPTALAHSKHAIVINSFSKYFLLPGWRLGWAVVPEALARAFESLSQNLFICPPSPSQYAAIAMFDHLDYLNDTVRGYAENRTLLVNALRGMGFGGMRHVDGAFYAYANIEKFSKDSGDFCHRMLHEAGVSAVPGTDFDSEHGRSYVRFSYSGDMLEIAEATERLKQWLG